MGFDLGLVVRAMLTLIQLLYSREYVTNECEFARGHRSSHRQVGGTRASVEVCRGAWWLLALGRGALSPFHRTRDNSDLHGYASIVSDLDRS